MNMEHEHEAASSAHSVWMWFVDGTRFYVMPLSLSQWNHIHVRRQANLSESQNLVNTVNARC